ncbi:hypothetical protein [Sphingobium sp.]|uniref:hypothetical protein n=1 Tax=Sphingobium sp. TaxID=1912891 RepID=UPI003B3A27A0
MFTRNIRFFAVASAMLSIAPLATASAATPLRSFGEIEFRSDPASLVDEVRADLAAHMPTGTSLDTARAMLKDAGAKCRPASADGAVRCRYYGIRVHGDGMEPVSWTVDLNTTDNMVQSFTLVRQ